MLSRGRWFLLVCLPGLDLCRSNRGGTVLEVAPGLKAQLRQQCPRPLQIWVPPGTSDWLCAPAISFPSSSLILELPASFLLALALLHY